MDEIETKTEIKPLLTDSKAENLSTAEIASDSAPVGETESGTGAPVEESLIDELTEKKYRIWKKNAPFLYDYLSTNSLLWPSLTIQFFPDITHKSSVINYEQNENQNDEKNDETTESDVILQRLLHGTFTMGQSPVDSISILQVPTYTNLNKKIVINKLDYNQEKEEFELNLSQSSSSNMKPKVLQKINQYGDVNKLKYMPQKPNVIASANNYGDLIIFERTRHKSFQKLIVDDTQVNKVQIRLVNDQVPTEQKVEIYAMDWNKNMEGLLVSANMNGIINLHDVTKYNKLSNSLKQERYWQHGSGVNDIEWVPTHDSLFGVTDEAGNLSIYDTRELLQKPKLQASFGTSLNSISINPNFPSIIAVGDSKGVIHIRNLQNLNEPLYELKDVHQGAITQLKWHPKFAQVLASSSTDSLVKIHDLSILENGKGLDTSVELSVDTNHKMSATIFQHLGHMLGVNDFDWSFADDWMIASVADDNSLHIWKPPLQVVESVNP